MDGDKFSRDRHTFMDLNHYSEAMAEAEIKPFPNQDSIAFLRANRPEIFAAIDAKAKRDGAINAYSRIFGCACAYLTLAQDIPITPLEATNIVEPLRARYLQLCSDITVPEARGNLTGWLETIGFIATDAAQRNIMRYLQEETYKNARAFIATDACEELAEIGINEDGIAEIRKIAAEQLEAAIQRDHVLEDRPEVVVDAMSTHHDRWPGAPKEAPTR